MKVTLSQPPTNRSAEIALEIYAEVLKAVHPSVLIPATVRRVGEALFIHHHHLDLSSFNNVWIAGAGKASVSMAEAIQSVMGSQIEGGLLITPKGPVADLEGIRILQASHPYPDESSLHAGQEMLKFAQTVQHNDLVIFLLSGGASALMESLKEGVDLADLQHITRTVMNLGGNIQQLNAIRSKLSRIKAGGLTQAFSHAHVVVLVLSDVVGNDLNTIGSAPFRTPKPEHPLKGDQRSKPLLLDWNSFPPRVQELCLDPAPTNIEARDPDHFVIGDVTTAVRSAAESAERFGLTPLPYADPLKGEARDMARKICRLALKGEIPNSVRIFGGETTVTVTGQGNGGRAQEMAVAAAPIINYHPNLCFLSAGTDGFDGPSDAAGGLVDADSIYRASMSVKDSLRDNNSYQFLEESGGLIKTGPTGTNVNDLVLIVHVDH